MLRDLWDRINRAPLWAVEMFGVFVVVSIAELSIRNLRGWLALVALVIVLGVNRALGHREGYLKAVRDLEEAE